LASVNNAEDLVELETAELFFGSSTVEWRPESGDPLGSYKVFPRVETDALSSVFPYTMDNAVFSLGDVLIADVPFSDPMLRNCVLEYTNARGWIWVSEVDQLQIRNVGLCNPFEMVDTDGLDLFTSLTFLWIRDAGPQWSKEDSLKNLPVLNHIRLGRERQGSWNHLDYAWLSGIETLEELNFDLYSNASPEESNWNVIPTLTSVRRLTLPVTGGQQGFLEVIAPMVDLTYLSLRRGAFDDISAISNLVNLIELDLFGLYYLTDLSPLTDMSALQVLSFSQSGTATMLDEAVDLSPLMGKPDLRVLNIQSKKFASLTPLTSLTGLEELQLRTSDIQDISALASLSGLKSLYLGINNISNISPISNLTALETLHLNYNEISDLSVFASTTFPNMKNIQLGSNQITDITALAPERLPANPIINLQENDLDCSEQQAIKALFPSARVDGTYQGENCFP
jgi:internalin A